MKTKPEIEKCKIAGGGKIDDGVSVVNRDRISF